MGHRRFLTGLGVAAVPAAGTPNGRTFRARGKGAVKTGTSGERGDLLITVAPTGAETTKADCPQLPTTLAELAARHLPGYMVPTAFVVLYLTPVLTGSDVDRTEQIWERMWWARSVSRSSPRWAMWMRRRSGWRGIRWAGSSSRRWRPS